MLDELHITDVALIRDAWFTPSPRFTVITGETGTGKTALLNAFKLAVGERAEAGLVREGQHELRVEARFYRPQQAADDVVVVRRVGAQGRSRVAIDGAMASVRDLAEGVGASVDLCGQHEHQRLLHAKEQRVLFDAWAEDFIGPAKERYYQAFLDHRDALAYLDDLRQREQQGAYELDQARFVVAQVEAVDPQEGEYEQLLAEMPRFEHGETLLRELKRAQHVIAGAGSASDNQSHEPLLDSLEELSASLARAGEVDSRFAAMASQVKDAYFTLEDMVHTLASFEDSIDFSPEELQRRQDRIAAFQGLMRSFGPRMEDVFSAYHQAVEHLRLFEQKDEVLSQAQARLDAAEASLLHAAEALAQARHEAAPRFEAAINEQLAHLDMGSAHVICALEDMPRAQWNAWGSQTFDLLFAAGSDLQPHKLSSIASGGEISRVMLAIKVVVGSHDQAETLVFDEIDAGVGGKAAVALADVLAELAQSHQVIVVSHLPQVAAKADVHYRVYKSEQDGLETCLEELTGESREEEIARMLSGTVTPTSLSHARELLAG